jgi:molybdopterin-containing oxidoreductase family iron-sulfur binding subunit
MARVAGGGFEPISWEAALTRIAEQLATLPSDEVWFVTGQEAGSFDALVSEWLDAIGSSHRVVHEPFAYEALRQANRTVFELDSIPQYDFAAARYLVSFGADFLETWLSPVEQSLLSRW